MQLARVAYVKSVVGKLVGSLLVVSVQFSYVSLHCPQTSLEAEDAGSDEEESEEALNSASPSPEHDVEGLSQEGDEGKEEVGGEEAEKGGERWQEAEETDTSDEEVENSNSTSDLHCY